MLTVCAEEAVDLQRDSFAGSLEIVSGHLFFYAWFLAMHHALDGGNLDQVARLWQCGLSVRAHAYVGLSPSELAVLSIKLSEARTVQPLVFA